MELLNFIKQREQYQIALWAKNFNLHDTQNLFNLCCASLLHDFNYNEKRSLKSGDVVELVVDEKKFYLKYLGITKERGFSKVILTNEDRANTRYKFKVSDVFWRLNSNVKQNKKLSKNLGELNLRLPEDAENTIKIIAAKTDIPYENYNFFEKSPILYLTDYSRNEVIEKLRNWEYEGHAFLDYFPAYFYLSNGEYKKINTELYDRTDPERILYIFNELENLFEFVEKPSDRHYKYFIISDSFKRIFNSSKIQTLYQILDNDKRRRFLYVGNSQNFKKMNKEKVHDFRNFISPVFYGINFNHINKLVDNVRVVGDEETNNLINLINKRINKYKDLNQNYSDRLRRALIHLLNYDAIHVFHEESPINIFKDEYPSDEIILKVEELQKKILTNNYKINDNSNELNIVSYPLKVHKHTKSRNLLHYKDFLNEFDTNLIYNLTFVKAHLYKDYLLPRILFEEIGISNICFQLYELEEKILKQIAYSFLNYYTSFIDKENPLSKKDNVPQSNVVSSESPFEFDVSIFDFNAHFLHELASTKQPNKDKEVVRIDLLDEKEGSQYYTFISTNHKLTVLEDEQLINKKFDKIQLGDVLLYTPGIKNVLESFSNIVQNKEIDIDLKDKWKEALKTFNDQYSFKKLIKQLEKKGVIRSEVTIKNWLNNDAIIGPMNPREDVKKIAEATSDNYLMNNWEKVADVCEVLQNVSKILGRKIKKLLISIYNREVTKNLLLDYDEKTRDNILSLLEKIKIYTVESISEKGFIESNYVNQIFEKE